MFQDPPSFLESESSVHVNIDHDNDSIYHYLCNQNGEFHLHNQSELLEDSTISLPDDASPFEKCFLSCLQTHNSIFAASYFNFYSIIDFIIKFAQANDISLVFICPTQLRAQILYFHYIKFIDNITLLTNNNNSQIGQFFVTSTKEFERFVLLEYPLLSTISYYVFVDFVDNKTMAWENSILIQKTHSKFVFLSRPISNNKVFLYWFSKIQNQSIHYISIAGLEYPKTFWAFNDSVIERKKQKLNHKYFLINQTESLTIVKKIILRKLTEGKFPIVVYLENYEDCLQLASMLIQNSKTKCHELLDLFLNSVQHLNLGDFCDQKNEGKQQIGKYFQMYKEFIANGIAIYHNEITPFLLNFTDLVFDLNMIPIVLCTFQYPHYSDYAIYNSISNIDYFSGLYNYVVMSSKINFDKLNILQNIPELKSNFEYDFIHVCKNIDYKRTFHYYSNAKRYLQEQSNFLEKETDFSFNFLFDLFENYKYQKIYELRKKIRECEENKNSIILPFLSSELIPNCGVIFKNITYEFGIFIEKVDDLNARFIAAFGYYSSENEYSISSTKEIISPITTILAKSNSVFNHVPSIFNTDRKNWTFFDTLPNEPNNHYDFQKYYKWHEKSVQFSSELSKFPIFDEEELENIEQMFQQKENIHKIKENAEIFNPKELEKKLQIENIKDLFKSIRDKNISKFQNDLSKMELILADFGKFNIGQYINTLYIMNEISKKVDIAVAASLLLDENVSLPQTTQLSTQTKSLKQLILLSSSNYSRNEYKTATADLYIAEIVSCWAKEENISMICEKHQISENQLIVYVNETIQILEKMKNSYELMNMPKCVSKVVDAINILMRSINADHFVELYTFAFDSLM